MVGIALPYYIAGYHLGNIIEGCIDTIEHVKCT